jgi:dipeptidyl aminopeptidase/acylaminoacyl peptidase
MMLDRVHDPASPDSEAIAYWYQHIGAATDPAVVAKSPARAADRIKIPVLLIHGSDDTVVPLAQSAAMDAALTKAGKAHQFVRLPGEDHWLSRGATRVRVLKELEAFLSSSL